MYVYACQSCDRVVERRQSFQDAPLTDCDECGGALRRVLQPVGIIFRGSGFYSTDHRSSAASSANGDGASKEVEAAGAGSGASSGSVSPPSKESSPAPSTGPSSD
jgi:putative FmdB family regulatory protein